MSVSSARTAIIAWLEAVTGFTPTHVIWRNQNVASPSKPYVSLLLTALSSAGVDYKFPPNDSGAGDIVGNRDFTLSIQVHMVEPHEAGYVDPLDFLEAIRQSVDIEEVYADLIAANLAFVDTLLEPTDTTEIVGSEFEPRATMDLLMRIPYVTNDATQGVIERVRLQKTFKDADESTILVENVEIPEP